MRLIDADALWRTFENEPWYDNADRDKAQDLLDEAPTVDTEPVRHGQWKRARYTEASLYICSQCDAPAYKQHKYCPEYGFPMDAK